MNEEQERNMAVEEIEPAICALIDVLVSHGCDGVTLPLIGEYLCGMTQAASDVHRMAGEKSATDREIVRLRPLMRARGYEQQYRHCMKELGIKESEA